MKAWQIIGGGFKIMLVGGLSLVLILLVGVLSFPDLLWGLASGEIPLRELFSARPSGIDVIDVHLFDMWLSLAVVALVLAWARSQGMYTKASAIFWGVVSAGVNILYLVVHYYGHVDDMMPETRFLRTLVISFLLVAYWVLVLSLGKLKLSESARTTQMTKSEPKDQKVDLRMPGDDGRTFEVVTQKSLEADSTDRLPVEIIWLKRSAHLPQDEEQGLGFEHEAVLQTYLYATGYYLTHAEQDWPFELVGLFQIVNTRVLLFHHGPDRVLSTFTLEGEKWTCKLSEIPSRGPHPSLRWDVSTLDGLAKIQQFLTHGDYNKRPIEAPVESAQPAVTEPAIKPAP